MKTQQPSDKSANASQPSYDYFQGDQTFLSRQKIEKYVDEKKKLYNVLMTFLEDSENSSSNFQNLQNIINIHHEVEEREKFEHFLYLITDISNNFHRGNSFYQKVYQIIKYYQSQIKQSFTNIEIYNIFQSNKLILLFLFENNIMTIDDNIYRELKFKKEANGYSYSHFFYPEIKEFIGEQKVQSIKDELLTKDPNILTDFNEKRRIGENDSYICRLIRQDSVEEFISHVNKLNILLTSHVSVSLFETNSFLIENWPTLIEYSVFYGSIQIFQYLVNNKVELTPSLWLYAIHSRNPELIQILESKEIQPPTNEDDENDEKTENFEYKRCLVESIKCHHNEIADYINENFMTKNFNDSENREEIVSNILKYHNYMYFPNDFSSGYEFFYLCRFNYHTLVDLFIKKKEKDINEKINKGITLQIAASNNQIEIIYYLLLNKTKIEVEFFCNNEKLKRIAIPSSITSIDNDAFSCCSNLMDIIIPSSVTSIGNNAFNKCSQLLQVIIPSSVTSIGDNTFAYCDGLVQVTIPTSITSIGIGAFQSCMNLKQINIPPLVTSIGAKAFYQCILLKQIVIPPSVTSVGNDAFSYCKALEQVIIPESLTSIEKNVFDHCSSLKQITLPSSITSIGNNSFDGCVNLEQITIPSSITSIENHTFIDCYSLTNVIIPSSVTSIKDHAFKNCIALIQITIPPSVTSIGKYCFSGCNSLVQFSFPSSITSIEDFIFKDCTSLTEITIPSSVTKIGNGSFSGCSSLLQIKIPSSVASIGDYAFSNCSSLTRISIPSSVTSIKRGLFSKCSSLTEIEIPSSVTSIGSSAFYECTSLLKFSIPPTVTSIETCLFYGCSSLTEVEIPSSVTKIGIMAFFECTSLVNLSIPPSVINIEKFAFAKCTSLKGINSDLVFANIDDYEIKEYICSGSFSQLFRVVEKKTGHEFVLKSYRPTNFTQNNQFLESVAISSIPGNVKIHSFRFPLTEEEKERVKTLEYPVKTKNREMICDLTGYIVITELINNVEFRQKTLEYLKNENTEGNILNPTIRSKLIFGVASQMKRLHKMNIINRDLKLDKIFLDENFEPKMSCSFLSKVIKNQNELEMAVGTPLCMAPELFMDGDDIYDLSIDVYAFGVLLFCMFSQNFVFEGIKKIRSSQHYMMLISRGNRPKRQDNIPDHYWELIQKCWQQNPDDRPTFEEIVNILKDDKFAIEEFGMITDLNQLHEYQQRVDID